MASNGPITTTNLRYFATGLRSWTNAIPRIPRSIAIIPGTNKANYGGATNADGAKVMINSNLTVSKIASALTSNIPDFTNRGGGMAGTAYLSNIAANIVDYVDTDPTPTSIGSTVGFDNYPLPVVFSDQIAWNQNVGNPSNSTIVVTTYIQFWNCSTLTSPAVTYTLQNNFQDTYLKSNGATSTIRLFPNNLINSLTVPSLAPNQVIILTTTNSTTVGTNAAVPGGLMIGKSLGINNNNGVSGFGIYTNLFQLRLGANVI
ncbi:MAG: hypothetical protein EBS60_08280, partial [Verrucomicrobia bacterium]|nr:hypothetical protein [Verrucomicrobiota bacterium]